MINLIPTQDQTDLAASVTAFLAKELPLSRLRASPEARPNGDASQWRQMAELGFFGLGLPEDLGGVGYGLVEEALVFREFGRSAVTPNVLATVIAAHAAAAGGRQALARQFVSGEARASLALPVIGWAVEGGADLHYLIDAVDADWIVVWDGAGVGLMERTGLVAAEPVEALDWTLPMAKVRLPEPSVRADVSTLPDRANVLIAAYQVGLSEAARDGSVEYAKVREQFGQPIGAFQSVKHRCADAAVRVEAAWCLVSLAALSISVDQPDAAFQIASARLMAGDAAMRNAAANIQNHGASGFTAELEAHVLLKRSHLMAQLGGDTGVQQRRLIAQPAPV